MTLPLSPWLSTMLSFGLGANSKKNMMILIVKKTMVMMLSGRFHFSGNLTADVIVIVDVVDINPQKVKFKALLL